MKRFAILVAFALASVGGCVSSSEADYDLPEDQYPPLDEKADFAVPVHLSTAPRGTFSYGDALWMSFFVRISYLPTAEFTAATHAVSPTAKIESWQGVGSTAFYVDLPDAGVLVFRGTDDAADVLADISATPVPTKFGAVHAGFANATATALYSLHGAQSGLSLRDFISRRHSPSHREKPLYITGHSLGAAMAELSYLLLELDGCKDSLSAPRDVLECANTSNGRWWIPVHAVYTFGAPRIGDSRLVHRVGSGLVSGGERAPLFRIVNRGDIVTTVPNFLSHPVDAYGDENAYLIHMGTTGLTYGEWEGSYAVSTGDHATYRYSVGLRDHRSGPAK